MADDHGTTNRTDTHTASDGGSNMAYIVGGIVVVLAILAWVLFGGSGGDVADSTGGEAPAAAESTTGAETGDAAATDGGAAMESDAAEGGGEDSDGTATDN